MTLNEWLEYLERLHPTTIELGLERVRQVADRLSLDFSQSRIIIVGGTNGKGSTVTLLSAILRASGKRVGTYMSPHINVYNERVSVDGEMASDEALCSAFEKVETARQNTSLTYFEFGTLCALVLFAEEKPDYVILEVGLGGRLDAVNILEPNLSILTNVALDHMDWLGDTRDKIGYEKAGIFRPGKPAIYGELDIPDSVQNAAEALGTFMYRQAGEFLWSQSDDGSWSWQGVDSQNNRVARYNLPATRINRDNASCVLQALALLEPDLEEAAVHKGLENAVLQGRFQQISADPAIVVDVAHNAHAMKNLAMALENAYSGKKLHIVIAMLADKDSRDAVKCLAHLPACWYVGQIADARGAPVKILYNHLLESGVEKVQTFDTVEAAFKAARDQVNKDDLILVTGSFFTVSAVLAEYGRKV